MLTSTNELLTKIGSEIVQAAPDSWEKLIVVAKGMGGSVRFQATAYVDDGSDTWLEVDTEADFAILKLRKAMYKPGAGTWYIARFTVDESGQLDSEFDYESSPFDDELDKDMRDVLRHDQKLYPRGPEHLPSWHPDARGA